MAPVLTRSSAATLIGLIPHYLAFYLFGWPPLTQTIAEWIMARTPSKYALWMLDNLGSWAKPLAMTGGLAALGFAVLVIALMQRRWMMAAFAVLPSLFFGGWTFWLPALLGLIVLETRVEAVRGHAGASRRDFAVMAAGTIGVAIESFARDAMVSRRAVGTREIATFDPPPDRFAPGLVRPAVTPAGTFYAMSKNTVDPALDPKDWRLRITVDGRTVRSIGYGELLSMPRQSEYVTLRCISNTLQSDLMGTALWSGVLFDRIVDRRALPDGIVEVAVIGVDGHGDSFEPGYLFNEGAMLAVGMNGRTLDRTHGFPARLIAPRYYGFKNVKWIGEIAFVRQPYFGTWPKLGYTKEPVVHTASHIDKILRDRELKIGGVSFAGDRGISRVQVRADDGPWVDAALDAQLSKFTWTRWQATLPLTAARQVEARARDGAGNWQEAREGTLFPDGVKGPTIRRIT